MAAEHTKSTPTGVIFRFRCNRARASQMRRRGYERPAFVAMQIMHDGFLQTKARHAILRFGQLELGRPIASSVLQPQHRYESFARIGHHDLQAGSSAT